MKVVVYPHDLGPGGSQLNAIELAAAVGRRGHEIVIYGVPGPLCEYIHRLGLPFVAAPVPGVRPSGRVVTHLARLLKGVGADIVHGYEWPPSLEAFAAGRITGTTPVSTVMSMSVAPFLPRGLSMTVGTAQIAAHETRRGRRVTTLVPPVDLRWNAGHDQEGRALRAALGLTADTVLLVVVGRLARELKLEGLLSAIDAMTHLASQRPAHLLIVGDGPAADRVLERAADANRSAGTPVVTCLGYIEDPRPAYAAADIVLGMGGSALRALAFGKPLVVQGERGFWRRCDETTTDLFAWQGWYGVGSSEASGVRELVGALAPWMRDADARQAAGAFGRRHVERHHDLDTQAEQLCSHYDRAQHEHSPSPWRDALTSAVGWGGYELGRRWQRLSGKLAEDDFNASPVAARAASLSLGRRRHEEGE